MLLGSSVMLSLFPVFIRRVQFNHYFKKHKRIVRLNPENLYTGFDDRLYYSDDKRFPYGVLVPPNLDPNTHVDLENQPTTTRIKQQMATEASINLSNKNALSLYSDSYFLLSPTSHPFSSSSCNNDGGNENNNNVSVGNNNNTYYSKSNISTSLSSLKSPLICEPLQDSIYDYRVMGDVIIIVVCYIIFWYILGSVSLILICYYTGDIKNYLDETNTNYVWFSIFTSFLNELYYYCFILL
jgi:hypothetical protein